MSDENLDFSELDLHRDPEKFERMVGAIMGRSRGELARRAAKRGGAMESVAAWLRPALASAAAVAIVSVTVLALVRTEDVPHASAYLPATDVPAAAWYDEDVSPTAAEVLVATNEGGR